MTAAARASHGVRAGLVIAAAVVGTALIHTDAVAEAVPTVVAGRDLVTSVRGFAPGAKIERRIDGVALPATVSADDRGRVRLRVRAPATPGSHRVLLIGMSGSPTGASPSGGAPVGDGGDPQAVVVKVPLVVTLDFRVVAGLGVDAVDRSRDGGDDGLGTAGETATADTGTNLWWQSLLGAGLVLLGAVVTVAGHKTSGLRTTAATDARNGSR